MNTAKHPFGIKPTNKEVRQAIRYAKRAYVDLPETTCNHRACCCNAGCPNMYYSEYLNIRSSHLDKMVHSERFEVLMQCIRYYLFGQHEEVNGKKVPLPRPCLHLTDDNMCKVYGSRPLKCRTYGLVPPSMHRRVLSEVAEESGIPEQEIPLCIQCPFVKVSESVKKKFPDGHVPEELIAKIEGYLRGTDRGLGITKKIQDEGYGFLSFHDWHIMSVLGEVWMVRMTPLREEKSREWKEAFIADLKEAFRVAYPSL